MRATSRAASVLVLFGGVMPDEDWIIVGAAIMLRLNFLLAPIGAAAGALRIGGTMTTRSAVVVASVLFAAVVYLGTIGLTFSLIPGYADLYGID